MRYFDGGVTVCCRESEQDESHDQDEINDLQLLASCIERFMLDAWKDLIFIRKTVPYVYV